MGCFVIHKYGNGKQRLLVAAVPCASSPFTQSQRVHTKERRTRHPIANSRIGGGNDKVCGGNGQGQGESAGRHPLAAGAVAGRGQQRRRADPEPCPAAAAAAIPRQFPFVHPDPPRADIHSPRREVFPPPPGSSSSDIALGRSCRARGRSLPPSGAQCGQAGRFLVQGNATRHRWRKPSLSSC